MIKISNIKYQISKLQTKIQSLNSKLEYRISKQFSNDQNPPERSYSKKLFFGIPMKFLKSYYIRDNDQNKNSFRYLNIWISDLFRISDFGFWILKFWIVTLIFAFWILSFDCYAQSISSSELINNAKQYDAKIVIYEGEVIGDIMIRGDFAWVNLNDGQNAIGIWMPKDFAETIEYKGSYSSKGDWIKIGGEFHRSCLQHGGDLDIHAKSIIILKKGNPLQEIINSAKQKAVLIFLGVAICLGILKILINKYRKS